MQLVTALPLFLCIWVIYRWNTQTAFLWVVLPTLLVLPMYFTLVIKPIPGVNFLECALIPLIVGMVIFEGLRWRPSTMDVWVLVFLVSTGMGDYLVGKHTQSIFTYFSDTILYLGCYMAGTLLIEQTGFRNRVVRAVVLLLVYSSIVSSYEFFFRSNPYSRFWNHFFPTQWAAFTTQVRWGFGRMSGPFGQSEIAGIMLLTGWLFALWIGRTNYQEDENGIRPKSILHNGKWFIWGSFLALYMTQARGPWLGGAIGLCFANIGRARRPLSRLLIVVALLVGVGVPTYMVGKDYIAGPRKNYGSERETAQYRAQLIDNYIPVAQKGGAWGWGLDFPQKGGQDSIDNEYLFIWLTQGWVGLVSFILIFAESLLRLVIQAVRAPTTRHLHFSVTMAAILIGIAFTISTVFLGGPTAALLFLLVGWTQSIRVPRHATRLIQNQDAYRPAAQGQLEKIYT